jgi:5-methylcytosine-specific restriction enzyme subunit McrC
VVDDLVVDVPHNRVVKAALAALAGLDTVDQPLRETLGHQLRCFAGVADVPLRAEAFRTVQLHRNIARYGFLLEVCELIWRNVMPDAATGCSRFHAFHEDEQVMGRVFEEFVYQFLRLEQRELEVSRPHLRWSATAADPAHLAWLPELHLDVLLRRGERRRVIETKYHARPVSARYGGSRKLKPGHLYQLRAYLEHVAAESALRPSGVLLYAAAREPFDLSYMLDGFDVRVVSLDLDQPWQGIRDDLTLIACGP